MSTAQQSSAPPVDPPKSSRIALYSLSLGYFAMGTASLAVVGLSVPMGRDLHVDPARIGLLVTVFALVFAVAAPLAPILLSRLDRKWTMVLGLTLLTLGSVISAITPSYGVVVAARIVAALGAATFAPLASAAGSIIVPEERRQAALATVFAGMTIASVLGVPLATFLSGGLGWRPALLGVAILCAIGLGGVLLFVPRLSTGVRPTASAYREVFGTPGAAVTVSTTLLFMAAQFVVYGIAGAFLTQRFGATSSTTSITLLAFGVLGVLGNATAGRVGDRAGAARLVTVALAGLGVAYVALLATPRLIVAAMVIFAFWAYFSQLYQAPQQSRLVTLLPNQRALILALNAAALYLGMSVGSLLGSSLLDRLGATLLPGVGLVLLVGAGLAHAVSRQRIQSGAALVK